MPLPTPCCGFARRGAEVSQGKALLLRSGAAGFTCACVRVTYRATPSMAGLPHRAGLLSGFCSSAPGLTSGFLPTPPRGDAVAFGLRFPSPGLAEGLHLLHQSHAWHTNMTSPRKRGEVKLVPLLM